MFRKPNRILRYNRVDITINVLFFTALFPKNPNIKLNKVPSLERRQNVKVSPIQLLNSKT